MPRYPQPSGGMRKRYLEIKKCQCKTSAGLGGQIENAKGHQYRFMCSRQKTGCGLWYALNGFLPDIVDNETTLKRKIGSIFNDFKLEFIRTLGYHSRKEFVDSFSLAILTQKKGG